MRISAINNNQFKTINNRQSNNVSFNGLTTKIDKILTNKTTPLKVLIGMTALAISYIAGLSQRTEAINKIGNFINSENYNKDSLKVKDYTNDGVLDFELIDKDGNKVIYDAYEGKLLEYRSVLQEIK